MITYFQWMKSLTNCSGITAIKHFGMCYYWKINQLQVVPLLCQAATNLYGFVDFL